MVEAPPQRPGRKRGACAALAAVDIARRRYARRRARARAARHQMKEIILLIGLFLFVLIGLLLTIFYFYWGPRGRPKK
jgi:hypothetical protein